MCFNRSLLMHILLQDHHQATMLTTRNVKLKSEPVTLLPRNLSSLYLLENELQNGSSSLYKEFWYTAFTFQTIKTVTVTTLQ